MSKPEVLILSARVDAANGAVAAFVEYVPIGGGTQTVNVDGTPEVRVHPSSYSYHVRMISPDRMIADQLVDADSYEAACKLALKYASKLNEHAVRAAELAQDLAVTDG